MTTGMPELGSKISLISKADIRYEGRLFTVDPQECTIALASVRSFGTEDREAQFPVPAQNQVYDYILFRGSDIKDIRVVNSVSHPQPLNDPAIMQLSVPPSLGAQPFQQHPILGHMGHNPYGSFLPMGGLTGAAPGLQPAAGMRQATGKPSELIMQPPGGVSDVGPPGSILSPPPVGEGARPNDHPDLISGGAAGGSRSTTPASMGSRKSLSVDQGTQAGGKPQRDGNKRPMKPIQPPRGQHPRNKSRDRRDSQNRGDNQEHRGQMHHQNQGQLQNRGRQPQQQNHQGAYQQQNHQGYQQARGGWGGQQRGGMLRGRGRPRGGPFRPGAPRQGSKGTTLKFENDYDFETANTEFEELKTKLGKLKVNDEPPAPKPVEVNGAVPETDKKDDSGNETGAGETEQEEEQEIFYDKAKSFFDKISCEAVERAKGKMQRTDWRQERKLNSETFGVAATRRGGFRGRGGYRGGFRGGFRGGYRHPNQRRNIDQPQQHNNQQQQQQGVKNDKRQIYCPPSNEEILTEKSQQEAEKPQVDNKSEQQANTESQVEEKEALKAVVVSDNDKATESISKIKDENETVEDLPKVVDETPKNVNEKIKETEVTPQAATACVGQ